MTDSKRTERLKKLRHNEAARKRYWLKKAGGNKSLADEMELENEQRFWDKLDRIEFEESKKKEK